MNPTGPACDCPGCVCSFCPCPLGICGCKKAIAYSESSIELGDDVGTADAWIENSKIYLKFDQQTAVNITALGPDDVVPISIDLEFSSYLCSLLGKTSIILPEGNYVVDYSGTNNTYGTIEIPAIMN